MMTLVSSGGHGLCERGVKRVSSRNARPGSRRWWLAREDFVEGKVFERIPRVDGTEPFEMMLDLDPGDYTLGCGDRVGGPRITFKVEGE